MSIDRRLKKLELSLVREAAPRLIVYEVGANYPETDAIRWLEETAGPIHPVRDLVYRIDRVSEIDAPPRLLSSSPSPVAHEEALALL